MATIKQNLNKVRDAVVRERNIPGSAFIKELGDAAAKAIRAGVGSPEWKIFMATFADNEEQLKRLTAPDAELEAAGLDYVPKAAAYIAGGVICTSETTTHLPHRVTDRIDKDLPNKSDANFVAANRVVHIPPPPPVNPPNP